MLSPVQTVAVVVDAVMDGDWLMVTAGALAVAVQPLLSVIFTVYVPLIAVVEDGRVGF